MQSKAVVAVTEPVFAPVTLEIVIETPEELRVLRRVFGMGLDVGEHLKKMDELWPNRGLQDIPVSNVGDILVKAFRPLQAIAEHRGVVAA